MPAARSSELKADGDPLRLKLLGEELIAFRDSSGRIGVMDHRCPHRCASLFYRPQRGRWHPLHLSRLEIRRRRQMHRQAEHAAASGYKDKVKAKAYKATERNGVVWVYMGARAKAPPWPTFGATLMPESEVGIGIVAARMQLAPGARRRHRHLAFRLSPRRRARLQRTDAGFDLVLLDEGSHARI